MRASEAWISSKAEPAGVKLRSIKQPGREDTRELLTGFLLMD